MAREAQGSLWEAAGVAAVRLLEDGAALVVFFGGSGWVSLCAFSLSDGLVALVSYGA